MQKKVHKEKTKESLSPRRCRETPVKQGRTMYDLRFLGMEYKFIDFWHLYAPQKEFKNRYQCCERIWNTMEKWKQRLIILQLEKDKAADPPVLHKKNPYFFLMDWEPPQPHWLTPAETGYLLAQHVPLAVCRNSKTQRFGTVTKEEAETYALEVHHWM